MKEPKKKPKPTIKYYKIVDENLVEYHIAIKGLYRYMYFIVPDGTPAYQPEEVWCTSNHAFDVSWSEYRHLNKGHVRKVSKLEILVACGVVPSEEEIRKAIGTLKE